MLYNAFLYTKQCFTLHFYIQNNVLQCISIYKTMFYNAFLYTKQCFTMHFYIQNNVLQCIFIYKTMFYNAFLYTENNILQWHFNLLKNVLHFYACISYVLQYLQENIVLQCIYNAFIYTKQCFTKHFHIQNNVLQCISIQKTIFYNGFLSIKECFTTHANLLKNVLKCMPIC